MKNYEVDTPIINSPYKEPESHWYIQEGKPAQQRDGRRPSIVWPPRNQPMAWDTTDGTLLRIKDYSGAYDMALVNDLRRRVKQWREEGCKGATRITIDLLKHWRQPERRPPLFFAQIEAAETIIFLHEALSNYRQGVNIPLDEPSETQKADGFSAFQRYACKMATGSGKTMVMGMLAAWSILNKQADRGNSAYSDVVLVVCPNVTIREQLNQLDPKLGEGSIYLKRDLVPAAMMPQLSQGEVKVINWHHLERKAVQVGATAARVVKAGVRETRHETIKIGKETTFARGKRYLTEEDYERQKACGALIVRREIREGDRLIEAQIESDYYVESDAAMLDRILGRAAGRRQNVLVINDEAHHAYRIRAEEKDEDDDLFGEEDTAEPFYQEATVWVEGLDRLHRKRGINYCLDFSATPFFLGRVGHEINRPFPWTVSDFGLIDAIESGLTKIPQLAVRDTSGAEVAQYFNIWEWLSEQLTPREKGGRAGSPRPEAVLKYAYHPISLMAGLWSETLKDWRETKKSDKRPPVFILVCKNTKIAQTIYQWIAGEGEPSSGIRALKIEELCNTAGKTYTIRVDSKVVAETETEGAKSDEVAWMRFSLDTVGKPDWPRDSQGQPIYPKGFEDLAKKLDRPYSPPGRDVRCIVSVGMLTEGWDCNTVTHIVGIRPFMSQLLCEQVVGRGLRRSSYAVDDKGHFTEEVAKILGVPFEFVPFKATAQTAANNDDESHHVVPQREKEECEITFPRVDGYTQSIRNRIRVDWEHVPSLTLDPSKIPPEVELTAANQNNKGRLSLNGPGRIDDASLAAYRERIRPQEAIFEMAADLTRGDVQHKPDDAPSHVLFPQIVDVINTYLRTKLWVNPPAERRDVFLSPYYGWLIEILRDSIRPDATQGETPELPIYEKGRPFGSTWEVNFHTRKPVRESRKCHLNWVTCDTDKWEETVAYYIDRHAGVSAFVKNERLGFAAQYIHNGEPHDYVPDFIIRLNKPGQHYLILECKGYDPLKEIKAAAAVRWVNAVNADGSCGHWQYAVATLPTKTTALIDEALSRT